MNNLDKFPFDDCYKFITEQNTKDDNLSTMRSVLIHYLCVKFSDGVNINLSKLEIKKVCDILKIMGIKND